MRAVSKHVRAIILGALAPALMIGAKPSNALEELKVYRGVLVLEGKIVRGDYDKLRRFLGTKSNFDKISSGVFLASPGGNIAEAMKIGRLIRALRLSTDAPSGRPSGNPRFGESLIKPRHLTHPKTNYLCASACFFVYVAGVYRNPNWVGRMGIHRPHRSKENVKILGVDDDLNLTWRVRFTVQKYLNEMNVPDKYVDLIYSVPPNKMRLITQREFDSDLQGLIPELRDLAGAKCDLQTNQEKTASASLTKRSPARRNASTSDNKKIFPVPAGQASELVRCWMQVKTELSNEAWHKVFSRR